MQFKIGTRFRYNHEFDRIYTVFAIANQQDIRATVESEDASYMATVAIIGRAPFHKDIRIGMVFLPDLPLSELSAWWHEVYNKWRWD